MLELLLALALTLGASAGTFSNQAIDPPSNDGGNRSAISNATDPPEQQGGGGNVADPPEQQGGGG